MTTGATMTEPAQPSPRLTAELRKIQLDLEHAVDTLTLPVRQRIERDTGEQQWAEVPALVEQLEQAIESSSGAASKFSPRSKPPLYLDAVVMRQDIDEHLRLFKDRTTRAGRMRAWSAAAGDLKATDPDGLIYCAEKAAHWVSGIRGLLDPKPRFRMRGQACPECGTVRVLDNHDTDNDEQTWRPALEIDTDRGVCRCVAHGCRAEWAPEFWPHLAAVLEQQQHETLACATNTE